MIAFIGSVFSPYYAWSGRGDPLNHCALNVALYGDSHRRWAMTERGRSQVVLEPDAFSIGPSELERTGDGLVIRVNEICAPIPGRLRGEIRVRFPNLNTHAYALEPEGAHRWSPLSPSVDVEVDFQRPSLSWRGRGYFDANQGDAPLEEGFEFWDWSRIELPNDETAILYNTTPRTGRGRRLALRVGRDGSVDRFETPPAAWLPRTNVWRVPRPLCAEEGAARVLRTCEDTPFYSRSVIESGLFGEGRRGMHESFSGDRLRTRWVKTLLPFRMPRLAR